MTLQLMKKNVLVVVSSPSVHPTLGYPIGFWASELTHAWLELEAAGYGITLASPKGGKVLADPFSDPRDPSGYSADDWVSLGFLSSPKHASRLESTTPLADVAPSAYDALWVVGGQGPMFTFRDDPEVLRVVRESYESGKVTALVCHAVCALLDLRLSDGKLLVEGRHITGFSNAEEDAIDLAMKTLVMPFRIQDEAVARGAAFSVAPPFAPFAVRDGHLVTGQQQYSGRAAARLLVEALGH
jgi:putative intracellular protease/amidase